jgi:CheY-like chemotaxis protein
MRRVADEQGRPGSRTGAARACVLYVEDDDDSWEVAEFRLAPSYELQRAKTAEEACTAVRTRGACFDLVLMDIELRGSYLNGVELTELLRGTSTLSERLLPAYARNLPALSTPLIYLTAHGRRYTTMQLTLSGADLVLPKPIDFAELETALRRLTAK